MKGIATILPVYKNDKAPYFRIAIDSILNQVCSEDITIYVGVDGPVERDLYNTIKNYEQHEKVYVYWFIQNRGLAVVLNELLTICFNKGYNYIARMDADDISMPDRFEKQLSYFHQNKEVDVVGGAIEEIDENGNLRGKTIIYPETPEECRLFFARRNPHAHPAVMFQKSFFEKMGGRLYRSEYRQNQDTMLWYDGMMAGTNHANIPDIVLQFRITDSLFKKRRSGWRFAKKQLHDRLVINKGLGYGFNSYLFGYAMFVLLISPPWVKRIAYKVFR